MGFRGLSSLAWRNLWRRPGRTLLTLATVAIAVSSLILLSSFLRAWSGSTFKHTVEGLTSHGQIHQPGFLEDPSVTHAMDSPKGTLHEVLESPRVEAWAPRVVVPALIRSERENAPVLLYGVDPRKEAEVSFFRSEIVEGDSLAGGTTSGLVIGKALAKRLKIQLNHRLVIAAQDVDGNIAELGVRVTGFFYTRPDLQKQVVFLNLAQAQTFLGLQNRISEVAFLAPHRQQVEVTTAMLQKSAPELDVRSWRELQPFAVAMIEMANSTITIWTLVSFVLVALGLVNALMLGVFERLREFALMQALGMKPLLILSQILLESVFLLSMGTLAGAILGVLTIQSFSGGLDLGSLGSGAGLLGAGQTIYPQLHPREMAVSCLTVLTLSLFASLFPAARAARRMPVDVLSKTQT